jgi:phage terminase large subunit GpA-like protein
MTEAAIQQAHYAPAPEVVAHCFATLHRPEALGVAECALKYRKLENPRGGLSGAFTFDTLPYLRRPHDCCNRDSGFEMVAVQGPSQSGKSTVGDNFLLHTVICDPGDLMMVGPDQDIVRSYVVTQINPMIAASEEMRSRLLATPGANNIHSKQFLGCNFFAVWPVKNQLRARPAPLFRVDDFDAIPEDIEGEGSLLMLLSGRQTTFEGSEFGYVNSSPALGNRRGIAGLVAQGTNETWRVPCPHCGEYFSLDFEEHCHFPRGGSPAEARLGVHLICPSGNGCVIEQKHKAAMMDRGRWAGPDQIVEPDGTVVGELAQSHIASFTINGLMTLATWGKLAQECLTAEQALDATGDEHELKGFYQSKIGVNYKSQLEDDQPVEADDLKTRSAASGYLKGTVPAWVLCLTAAVDIQIDRFEVLILGWGVDNRTALIDRFAIVSTDGGTTKLAPARRPEHWTLLLDKVMRRRWPVAGDPRRSVGILNTAVDTGGVEGVTDNAYAFWHACLAAKIPATAITLIKGGNRPEAKLLPTPTRDEKRKGRKGDAEPEVFVPNVHRFKNILEVRLKRALPGPGYCDFPSDCPEEVFDELTAEEKVNGLWCRVDRRPNESLDLYVYSLAAIRRLGAADASLAWLPTWARPKVRPATDVAADPIPPADPPKGGRPRRPRIRSIRTN